MIGYVPTDSFGGVPRSVAVPFPLSVKVTPVGSAPTSASDAAGKPVVVTLKLPGLFAVNTVLSADVMTGAISIGRSRQHLIGTFLCTRALAGWLANTMTPTSTPIDAASAPRTLVI